MKLAVGCSVAAIALWLGWLVLLWWVTGILVDWVNNYYHLGLPGIVAFAFHLVAWLVIGGITGNAARSVKSE